MDRLVFEVRHNNVYSNCVLIKDLLSISCRIRIDFEKNIIIAENIKDKDVNDLYNLISKHFSILSIDLINNDDNSESQEASHSSDQDDVVSDNKQDNSDLPGQDNQILENAKPVHKKRVHVSGNQEKVLSRYIKPELDKIDLNSDPKDQILRFLENINMPREDMIVHAFEIAYNNPRVTYSYLTKRLSKIYPSIAPTAWTSYFQNVMKNWVENNHPEIMKECKIISFITLLRMYARKFT